MLEPCHAKNGYKKYQEKYFGQHGLNFTWQHINYLILKGKNHSFATLEPGLMHYVIDYSFSLSDQLPLGRDNCNKSLTQAFRGLIGSDPETELEISNHYNLTLYPEFAASLSHTGKIGAALLAPINKYPSVGIDIELKDRKITKGAQKYFFNEHDRPESNPLEIWTKKEAAFKALSPVISKFKWKKVLLLKHIWIKGDKFGLLGRKKVLGKIVKLERNLGPKTILISLALLKTL